MICYQRGNHIWTWSWLHVYLISPLPFWWLQTSPLWAYATLQTSLLSSPYWGQRWSNQPDLVSCIFCLHRQPLQIFTAPILCLPLLIDSYLSPQSIKDLSPFSRRPSNLSDMVLLRGYDTVRNGYRDVLMHYHSDSHSAHVSLLPNTTDFIFWSLSPFNPHLTLNYAVSFLNYNLDSSQP